MAESEKKWNKFQRLRVKPGRFSERAKKAESATVKHARRFVIDRIHSAREVRRNIALWLMGMGVLIAVAAVQFFLFQSSYTTVASGNGGTYAEAMQGNITTLNPLYAATESERAVSRLLFSSLLTYDKTGQLRGDLAERYSVLEGGKRYRVTLKPVVLWHDGKRLTSDDVVFTVKLLKDPMANVAYRASWNDVDVKKIDDRTVDFVLPTSYAPFPHALTFPVVPKHLLAGVAPANLRESSFTSHPIGSGPFSFRLSQNVQTGDERTVVHMNKNQSYYDGAPKVDRFQLHSYKKSDSLVRALRSHAVNAVSGVSLAEYKQLKNEPDTTTELRPVSAGVFALFNTHGTGPLNDIRIRKALQVGTDVRKAINALPVELPVLDTPLLDSHVSLTGIDKPKYDEKRAATLLDEAGWKLKDGERFKDKEPLSIRLVGIKDADYELVIANLAKQWRGLGVRVETKLIDTNDPSQNIANSVLQPRDFDVLVHELTLGADPDVYAYWHSSQAVQKGLNFSNYNSGVSDDTLASARTRIESELREAKYRSFVSQWLKDAPALGLYQSSATYAHTSSSSAFDKNEQFITPTDRFDSVNRWSVQQEAVYKTP